MINTITLVGRMTADPECRFTQGGIAVTNFTLAVERSFKDETGKKQVDFIPIVVWRKLAELINQYMKKGSMVGVVGRLQMRKYQTKEGETRTVYEVLAEEVQFLDGRSTGNSGNNLQEGSGAHLQSPPDDDSDLPF